ncbi:MAG: DEAD/DEAH box helicase [Isosphaeraceae bacterium]
MTENSQNAVSEADAAHPIDQFDQLKLRPTTLAALARAGYSTPSPIQAQLLPQALAGRDCLGNAPTGTGKTASFLLPILESIDDRQRHPQALVLAPTRELVHQIGLEFDKLSFGRRARAVGLVGGESIFRQQRMLASGCQLLLATPGRLIDLLERGSIRLDRIKLVVLDEADQMLDIGFRPAVETIMKTVPAERQTLLLSATMPPGVRELSRTYLNDPADVRLIRDDEDATVPAVRQSYLMVHPERKFELLVRLLHRERPSRAIVFCRTKRGADRLGTLLQAEGLQAEAMHGNLSQAQRNRVLHAFRTGRLTTLVATDVVGRGIDVRGVSHVVNFDLPDDPTHYVHRIGRTGRMGNDGAAFSLVLPDQGAMLDQIEKCIARELESDEVEGIPSPPRPRVSRPHRPAHGRKPVHGRPRGPRGPFRSGTGGSSFGPGHGHGSGRPFGGRGRNDRREASSTGRG